MNVAWYVTQQFHKGLDDICLIDIGAENPLLGSTVLYSSKTIEEKPTIAFVTDLLASEQLSAEFFLKRLNYAKLEVTVLKIPPCIRNSSPMNPPPCPRNSSRRNPPLLFGIPRCRPWYRYGYFLEPPNLVGREIHDY